MVAPIMADSEVWDLQSGQRLERMKFPSSTEFSQSTKPNSTLTPPFKESVVRTTWRPLFVRTFKTSRSPQWGVPTLGFPHLPCCQQFLCCLYARLREPWSFLEALNCPWFNPKPPLPCCLQFLRGYVPAYESRGRFWPHMHARIIGGLLLAQITMLGYFSIKKFPYTAFLVPLPVVTLLYYGYSLVRMYPSFRNPSLDMASRAGAPPPQTREELMAAFLPPSLSKDALEGVTMEEMELPGAPIISLH